MLKALQWQTTGSTAVQQVCFATDCRFVSDNLLSTYSSCFVAKVTHQLCTQFASSWMSTTSGIAARWLMGARRSFLQSRCLFSSVHAIDVFGGAACRVGCELCDGCWLCADCVALPTLGVAGGIGYHTGNNSGLCAYHVSCPESELLAANHVLRANARFGTQ